VISVCPRFIHLPRHALTSRTLSKDCNELTLVSQTFSQIGDCRGTHAHSLRESASRQMCLRAQKRTLMFQRIYHSHHQFHSHFVDQDSHPEYKTVDSTSISIASGGSRNGHPRNFWQMRKRWGESFSVDSFACTRCLHRRNRERVN